MAHKRKQKIINDFRKSGLSTYPIFYEDFLEDKRSFFGRMMDCLNIEISKKEIDAAIEKGTIFKKVHSNDISEFVINHEEVMRKFGHFFVAWDNNGPTDLDNLMDEIKNM
jgi:hypothetical protein